MADIVLPKTIGQLRFHPHANLGNDDVVIKISLSCRLSLKIHAATRTRYLASAGDEGQRHGNL